LGASSAPSGAFGQPSTLGAKPSPFGAATSAFGTPSQLGNTGAFGQPSALGQKPNSFGALSGGAAPFSAFAAKPSPFLQPAVTSAFGAPSQPAQSLSFGQAPSQPISLFGTANSLSFGAPSPAPKNPFNTQAQTQPQSTQTPFSSNTAPSSNPFVQAVPKAPSPFGNQQPTPSATVNPFAKPQPSTPVPSPFGQTTPSNANPFSRPGQPPQPIANGPASGSRELGSPHPHVDTYTTHDQSGRLLTFKGKRVVYKDGSPGFTRPDGRWQKIMFPTGPPQQSLDQQMPDEMYDDSIKEEYKYASKTGNFKHNKIPLLPPMNIWCSFDF
jgi:nucleoporin NUP42